MPRLACWSCGRRIYATAPVEMLWAEERRCPGCGATMNGDRRAIDRRSGLDRRLAPPTAPVPADVIDRRTGVDRRAVDRRRFGRPA